MENKKNKIPKIKKSLGKLLTNESKELSKKVLSGLLVTGGLITSGNINGVVNAGNSNFVDDKWGQYYDSGEYCELLGKAYHVSGVANGHVSVVPKVEMEGKMVLHTNHASHSTTCLVVGCGADHLNSTY